MAENGKPSVQPESGTVANDIASAVKKEAVRQVAIWVVSGVAVVATLAAVGWWFVIESKVREYIVTSAGGVPTGAVIASTMECSELAGKWTAFTEGTGRFLVGAGDVRHARYGSWEIRLPSGGVEIRPISTYQLLAAGGEENHILTVSEMPPHNHGGATESAGAYMLFGGSPVAGAFGSGEHRFSQVVHSHTIRSEGSGTPHNNVPPYLALYWCRKG